MKKIALSLLGVGLALSANMGCTKPGGGTTVSGLPDLINFEIAAVSSFVPGFGAAVSLDAPNLSPGTYTVNYNLTSTTTPADNLLNQVATLTMSGTTGSFNTANIPSGGNVSITINSISNSSGSSNVTSGNTKTFSDSTGLLTCKINGVSYRATDVKATLAGSGGILSIHSVLWSPLTTITLYWDNFVTGTTGTIYYNSNDLTPGDGNSTFNGSAAYGAPGIADLSVHGTLTISSWSPLLTGTFSFMNQDSTAMTSGSFSCPHP